MSECKHCGATPRASWFNKVRQQWQHYNECNACKMFWTRHRFRLTPDDRAKLDAEPWCHICGTTEDIVIDHCHKTNKVRHYLCRDHNSALGKFGDDIAGIKRALEYLNETTH